MKYATSILMGGLGNNLFQIAAAYSLSLKHERKFICSLAEVHSTHFPIVKYLNNIFRNITFSDQILYFCEYKEIFHEYKEIIPHPLFDIKLHGYFQSEKYFIDYKTQIQKLFEIDEKTKIKLFEKYKHIIESENTCSVHIRRGDYVNLTAYHPLQTMEYYLSSFSHFDKNTRFVFFSDDISWCKDNFKTNKENFFIENNEDYEDLYLMSMCKNNIIANSSFSWWGAWMNQNPYKKVIAPRNWFGPIANKNASDIYCEDWILI